MVNNGGIRSTVFSVLLAAAAAGAVTASAAAHADPQPPPAPPSGSSTPGVLDHVTGDILNGLSRKHLSFTPLHLCPAFPLDDPGLDLYCSVETITAVNGDIVPVVPYLSAHNDSGTRYPVLWQHGSPEGINPSIVRHGETRTGVVYFAVPRGVVPTGIDYTETADPQAPVPALVSFNLVKNPDYVPPKPAPPSQSTEPANSASQPDPLHPAEGPAGIPLAAEGVGADQEYLPKLGQFSGGQPVGAASAAPADGDGTDTPTSQSPQASAPTPADPQVSAPGPHSAAGRPDPTAQASAPTPADGGAPDEPPPPGGAATSAH